MHVAHPRQHRVEEVAGLRDGRRHGRPAARDRTAAADKGFGAKRRDVVQGAGRPFLVERVTGIQGGLGFHQVPGEQDLLTRQPRNDVAFGMAASAVGEDQLAAAAAQVNGEPIGEGSRRPRQSGNGPWVAEQPWHPG
jgi:hypothetical protein